jgi:hypothetical protein
LLFFASLCRRPPAAAYWTLGLCVREHVLGSLAATATGRNVPPGRRAESSETFKSTGWLHSESIGAVGPSSHRLSLAFVASWQSTAGADATAPSTRF